MRVPEWVPIGLRVAVIGAGLAGATCARQLAASGWQVHVLDKARGAGGRLSTRRLAWTAPDGQARLTALDHGAPGFGAAGVVWAEALRAHAAHGLLQVSHPRHDPRGEPLPIGDRWLPVPDMPQWCRSLLKGLHTHWSCTVDRLGHDERGWWVASQGQRLLSGLDAVVLAVPPAQAAPLLMPHRPDWATQAAEVPMAPCWTVMGVSQALGRPVDWAVSLPGGGPLARILRNDAKPGREQVANEAHWVLQARADWSEAHLEADPAWVTQTLQVALAEWLAQPVDWQVATAHRWRYAVPVCPPQGPACWWDDTQWLGVCGDFLGGQELSAQAQGAERAWTSAQHLAQALQDSCREVLA